MTPWPTLFIISTQIKTYGIAWNGEIIGAESVLSGTLSEEFTTKIKHLKIIKTFGCMLYDCADCQPQITQLYTITSYKQTYSIVSWVFQFKVPVLNTVLIHIYLKLIILEKSKTQWRKEYYNSMLPRRTIICSKGEWDKQTISNEWCTNHNVYR